MSNLAAATVALVILVDLATGQGPPVFTAYRDAMGPPVNHGPPRPLGPLGPAPLPYMPRGEYDGKEFAHKYDKELADEHAKESAKLFGKESVKEEKEYEKEKHKEYEKDKSAHYKDDKDAKDDKEGGLFKSLSGSVSGAWSKLG